MIWNYANGRDISMVESVPVDNKDYGNSTTNSFDVSDAQTAKIVLLSFVETVGRLHRKDGARIEVVSISIRFYALSYVLHQDILRSPT